MAYTTPDELIAQYGEDELSRVADVDDDFQLDISKIEEAILSAAAEIDSYIGARYPLPLDAVPRILAQRSREIAVYLMATGGGRLTDEIEKRYEQAIAHLRRIADGKAVLVMPVEEASDEDSESDGATIRSDGPQPVVVSGPERQFSREKMRGL